jgi:hypothetical protein
LSQKQNINISEINDINNRQLLAEYKTPPDTKSKIENYTEYKKKEAFLDNAA